MKIRVRLTIWYFSISLVILSIFSFGTYLTMRHLLINTIDRELNTIVKSVSINYNPDSQTFRDFNADTYNLNKYLKKFYLIVYDSTGNPIYYSPLAKKIALNIPLNSNQKEIGYTIEINSQRIPTIDLINLKSFEKTTAFRAISRKLYYEDNHVGWAILAIPIADINASLEQLKSILLIGIFFTVIFIGAGSYFLTRKSLKPISQITSQAESISHSNLNERIPVYSSEDELGQLTGVLNDLFERLQKAFESQKNFLSGAAHELKTPLAIIRAHWEGELNNPRISEEMKEKMVQDIETISRLSHLINNLILLSQTEAIYENFEFADVQFDHLMRDVITDCQVLAEMKSQELSIAELPEIKVRGDANRLYQLFFNVIDNAIKYTPEGGKIWIRVRVKGEQLVSEVRDDGIGISKENLIKIFDRFYRVQDDRARRTGGSGLGLSICKLIIEAHKGKIKVESVLGRGTVFTIFLPMKSDVD